MRIAMIGQRGMTTGERAGGVEKHVAEIAPRLVARGHEVTVYAREKYVSSVEESFGGVFIRFAPTIYTKALETITNTLFSTIDAIFRPYDIIHYHGVGPATLAWIPRLLAPKKRVVVTFHSRDQFHQKWGWFARHYLALGERAAVAFSHYCIAVSHEIQVYCRQKLRTEVVYIPNGAVVKDISDTEELEKIGLTPNDYFLFVGRLVPQKGAHFLIEAFRGIDTHKQLVIVGAPSFSDGYERRLKKLAEGDGRIRFLGFQSGRILEQLFSHAYAYIHPSEAEGLPIAVLEAMSFGTVPLVSDIPANLEAIHGAGESFKSGDVAALRKKIRDFLHGRERIDDMRDEVRAVIDIHFNWDTIAKRTEAVYITAKH